MSEAQHRRPSVYDCAVVKMSEANNGEKIMRHEFKKLTGLEVNIKQELLRQRKP
jgi:hypothetical protein